MSISDLLNRLSDAESAISDAEYAIQEVARSLKDVTKASHVGISLPFRAIGQQVEDAKGLVVAQCSTAMLADYIVEAANGGR